MKRFLPRKRQVNAQVNRIASRRKKEKRSAERSQSRINQWFFRNEICNGYYAIRHEISYEKKLRKLRELRRKYPEFYFDPSKLDTLRPTVSRAVVEVYATSRGTYIIILNNGRSLEVPGG